MNYGQVVKEGGFVEFKTDNDDLFEFTLEEIGETNYAIMEQTRNLHGSQYDSRLTMTEYEHKFYEQGKNINYVKIML